jgi:hypothetical protein
MDPDYPDMDPENSSQIWALGILNEFDVKII